MPIGQASITVEYSHIVDYVLTVTSSKCGILILAHFEIINVATLKIMLDYYDHDCPILAIKIR